MNLIRFILFLLAPIFLFSESKKSKDTPETEKIILWEGELEAIYKDRARVRVFVKASPTILGKTFSEIKDSILTEKNFPIKQKLTNKRIGIFEVLEVQHENTNTNSKPTEFQVLLLGKLKLKKKGYQKNISNDFFISMNRERENYVDPSSFYNDTPTGPKSSMIHPKDKKEMVLVPTGVFLHGQGTDGTKDDFNPAYLNPDYSNVSDLPSYYIDKYEVTNREYERYVLEAGVSPPKYWQNGKIPTGKEDHPVIGLSYREVEGYATWVGKRIPSELEWEKAARGSGLKITKNKKEIYTFEITAIKYPFGNKFDPILCNSIESKINDTVSVYELSTKSASPYGAIGMCGNAPEWTSSWYQAYEGHNFSSSMKGNVVKVIRGGSYLDSKKQCTVHHRSFGGLPNLSEDRKAGFRLVLDYRNN
ncbi:MAG: SUMF1/EgtB/PvdO family nonheme iron enzyme [Leptospiraceae bacterium]|nr:SUMF1/EgtB/PvdO family nonheme iron enzyme [Leptospiraceae bacterium]